MRTPHSLCLCLSLSPPSLSLLHHWIPKPFSSDADQGSWLRLISLHSRRGCGGFSIHLDRTFQGKKRPFLVFLHADEEICIAKGRGGGLAVWKKVDKAYREDEGAYV